MGRPPYHPEHTYMTLICIGTRAIRGSDHQPSDALYIVLIIVPIVRAMTWSRLLYYTSNYTQRTGEVVDLNNTVDEYTTDNDEELRTEQEDGRCVVGSKVNRVMDGWRGKCRLTRVEYLWSRRALRVLLLPLRRVLVLVPLPLINHRNPHTQSLPGLLAPAIIEYCTV